MWQRKAPSSTLGVVTAISIDIEKVSYVAILPKLCESCRNMKKLPLRIPLVIRHRSDLIIVILSIPALPQEWKQQELLTSLVYQKRIIDYITPLFMQMVTAGHILLSKIYMFQLNLLRRLNVSVTIKSVSVRGFVI